MSAHGPIPPSAWIFPALAMVLFGTVTATGYSFAPSPAGWLFIYYRSFTYEIVGYTNGDAAADLFIKVLNADGPLASADFVL